jgi:hypothetical protein
MKVSSRRLPSPAMFVAAIALTLAVAGTSIAADPLAKLTKSKVRKIANKEIDKRAPGLSVDEATFAITAGNSERLGNLDPSAFMRSSGCARGKVLGFARFNGAAFSASPAYSTAGVTVPENCSGGSVEASKLGGVGEYRIRFNGLDAVIAVCGDLAEGDGDFAITQVALSSIAPGHWRVQLYDPIGDSLVDGTFACIVV